MTNLKTVNGIRFCERERHHLLSRTPEDVNLVDVFEYIADCVMAGMARTGEVNDVTSG